MGGPQGGAISIKFSDLKNKPLGHTWSILFWTPEQLDLLDKLNNNNNLVLCGDYGTGKTSLLVFAAIEAAKDPNCGVFFIPATNMSKAKKEEIEFVLDEAVRLKFEGTSVKVVTIGDLRKLHGESTSEADDRHHLIREFIKTRSKQDKVFIDEMPLFQKDLERILDEQSTEFIKTLEIIEKDTQQTWIALSTLSLLDNSEDPDEPPLPEDMLPFSKGNYLKSRLIRNTTFTLQQLNLRARDCSNIGNCTPDDISKLSTTEDTFQTIAMKGASSVSTVAGERPIFVNMQGVEDADYHLGMKEVHSRVPLFKNDHAVILCGENVLVSKVSEAAKKVGYSPVVFPQSPTDDDVKQLHIWLRGTGGLLVTSNLQFSGMEASTCVFITNNIVEETGTRSGLLRATTRLVVISYTEDINLAECKKRFEVHDTKTIKEEWRKKEPERRKKEEEIRKEEESKKEEEKRRKEEE